VIQRILGTVAAAALSLPLYTQPASAATVPVSPHVTFGGTVNGMPASATVRMACFGPTHPGQTGHPLNDQTLGVFVPEVLQSPAFGHTGSRGHAIVARFLSIEGVSRTAAVFRRFTLTRPVLTATAPLPTALVLPCDGTGAVVFRPVPAGGDAKAAVVFVTFSNQP
jgi:hypothetical protein